MSRKKVTINLVVGILLGMFLISPILSFLGLPSFDGVILYIFGENNILALVFTIIILIVIIIGAYKMPNKDS